MPPRSWLTTAEAASAQVEALGFVWAAHVSGAPLPPMLPFLETQVSTSATLGASATLASLWHACASATPAPQPHSCLSHTRATSTDHVCMCAGFYAHLCASSCAHLSARLPAPDPKQTYPEAWLGVTRLHVATGICVDLMRIWRMRCIRRASTIGAAARCPLRTN
eukprot:135012-Chlamydomonas_euryale.AAC.4